MINWDRLNDLCEEVGPEDFAEVIEIFLEEVESVIDRLESNPVPSEYEADLHFLKGSALNLGFDAFASLCGEGERLASAGGYNEIDLGSVFALYRKSKLEFTSNQETKMAA